MATVYAATHMHLNERVAIKVLLANLAGNANVVERFMREARAAVRLKSEHVVRVQDVGSLPSRQPYIVMEFLDGTDLEATLAKRGKLPPAEVVDYVLQVCEALAEAHAAGIVHRDIKPANCVLSVRNDGMPNIKVLDFGIAKLMLGDDGPKLTNTQATMGTPAFMSPEQIRGAKDVDHRGDIWSVGVMLFELMVGHVPFQADTYGRLVMAVMREPTPAMPGVPPGLEQVVGMCLAKDRQHRYQTIAELAQALAPFAGNRPEATVIAQRCASLARPAGQRAATPVPGVPQHGQQPMMSTPAHGMPPQHGQQPMMSTPAHGMPRQHGQQPMMSTPAHGMPPQHGQQPMMSTPGHGMPSHQGQHPMMSTPGHGSPQMMSTPAHGMPPQYGQHPMMSTPGHGMPAHQGQHPMMATPGHGNQMMSTPAHGMPPQYGQQPQHGQQPQYQQPQHQQPQHGQYPQHAQQPQYPQHGHQPQYPQHGQPPQHAQHPMTNTGAISAGPTPTTGKSRRIFWFILIGVLAGGGAGLAILLGS